MSAVVIGLLLIATMIGFAANMQAHCKTLHQSKKLPNYTANVEKFAYLLLVVSFVLSFVFWTFGVALIMWTALLTLAAALVGGILSYRPQWLFALMPVCLLLSFGLIFSL